jgi:hypothetical protein
MMLTPRRAEHGKMLFDPIRDPPQLGPTKAIALPELRLAIRAMKNKDRPLLCALRMDMRRAVIIQIDGKAQAMKEDDQRIVGAAYFRENPSVSVDLQLPNYDRRAWIASSKKAKS